VLEALGVKIDSPVENVQRMLDECGWTFLFAPAFHAATKHAVGPRKEMGVRTAFNLLGPLTNPARPEAQIVGVPRPERAPFMARCLMRLGLARAWVVPGSGLDEISMSGPTTVAAFTGGEVQTLTLNPADVGLTPCTPADLKGGDAAANAAIARDILAGAKGPKRDAVLLNAAAALVVAGRTRELRDGVTQATAALDEGRAAQLVERLRKESHA
jgi:anthranilate phosphoribosyltransferase